MAHDSRIGSTVAGYRIERLLGRGGMGRVYLAEDTRLGRKVALKLLDPELADDERFRERFARESRLAASLDHPNVVPIYEAGEQDGVLFIAMRYVEGTDLARLIEEQGRLPPERTAAILTQVADALDAAHERGLIHRDVKPGNILVGRGDHTYLTDFGLIKRREGDTGLTRTGQFMGSVDYAAPEQIRGEPVDPRTDVYSLGCVLHECLTGEPPFAHDPELAVLYAHLNDPPPRVTARRPDLPSGIDAVVAKAMAKRPDDRYATTGDLAEAARDALMRVAVAVPEKPMRRRAALLSSAAAAVVVALVVAVALTRSGGGRPPASTPSSPGRSVAAAGPPLNSVVALDPATERITATVRNVPLGTSEFAGVPRMVAGEGSVWVYSPPNLIHIDARTATVHGVLRKTGADSIAVGFPTVWITGGPGTHQVDRVDPAIDRSLRAVRIPEGLPNGVAVGGGWAWVSTNTGRIVLIEAGTGRVRDAIPVADTLDAVAFGAGSVWGVDRLNGLVYRVDPRTRKVLERVEFSGSIDRIAVGEGALWILDSFAGTVSAVEPGVGRVGAPIPVGQDTNGVAAGLGSVWVSGFDGVLRKVDPALREVTPIEIGSPLAAVTVDEATGTVWVAVATRST